MIYIAFRTEPISHSKDNSLFDRFLKFIIPATNPDFDNQISEVSEWLLEFDDENSAPNREIGIDKKGKMILKMPYKNNYGYWTDNQLTHDDFVAKFDAKVITPEFFEQNWSLLG